MYKRTVAAMALATAALLALSGLGPRTAGAFSPAVRPAAAHPAAGIACAWTLATGAGGDMNANYWYLQYRADATLSFMERPK